jgi:diphosphoinositol-polyphosphate diphosphatase
MEERRSDEQIKKGGNRAPRALYRWFEVRVTKEEDTWPESHKRSRKWMGYAEARRALAERPELLEALERSGIKKD